MKELLHTLQSYALLWLECKLRLCAHKFFFKVNVESHSSHGNFVLKLKSEDHINSREFEIGSNQLTLVVVRWLIFGELFFVGQYFGQHFWICRLNSEVLMEDLLFGQPIDSHDGESQNVVEQHFRTCQPSSDSLISDDLIFGQPIDSHDGEMQNVVVMLHFWQKLSPTLSGHFSVSSNIYNMTDLYQNSTQINSIVIFGTSSLLARTRSEICKMIQPSFRGKIDCLRYIQPTIKSKMISTRKWYHIFTWPLNDLKI